jgi:DNA-binding transcriptional ArsR family regulator
MRADELFTALSDRTRRVIVDALAQRGPCTATQLASDLPITRQAVAKHLGHLHRAELVVAQREGRETLYRLVPDSFDDAIAWLERIHTSVADARQAA